MDDTNVLVTIIDAAVTDNLGIFLSLKVILLQICSKHKCCDIFRQSKYTGPQAEHSQSFISVTTVLLFHMFFCTHANSLQSELTTQVCCTTLISTSIFLPSILFTSFFILALYYIVGQKYVIYSQDPSCQCLSTPQRVFIEKCPVHLTNNDILYWISLVEHQQLHR